MSPHLGSRGPDRAPPPAAPAPILAVTRSGVNGPRAGYASGMTDHPQPASDEADPEKQTSPAGIARELEDEAEEQGATTDGTAPDPR